MKNAKSLLLTCLLLGLIISTAGCSLLVSREVVTLPRGETATTQVGVVISYREFYDYGDRAVVAVSIPGQPSQVFSKLDTGDTIEFDGGSKGKYDVKVLCASNYCGQFLITRTD